MSYILFIDSGIGGLTTLYQTQKLIKANYLYYADNLYSPYGNKAVDFIHNRLVSIVSSLIQKYPIKCVVLACNTATTTSISYLREHFPKITFIGTEPAVKMAIDQKFTSPAIIATPQTIKHLKCSNLNKVACHNLASNIENYFVDPNFKNKLALLKDIFNISNKIKQNDCLILGCTHYSFIKDYFTKTLNIKVLDGNQGVANQIRIKCKNSQSKTSLKIILSSKKNKELQNYKKILNQILANQINL